MDENEIHAERAKWGFTDISPVVIPIEGNFLTYIELQNRFFVLRRKSKSDFLTYVKPYAGFYLYGGFTT